VSIDSAAGSGFATREDATVDALESWFEIDVDEVVLVPADGRRFRVVVADTTPLDPPPEVSIERTGAGFIATGITC